MSRILDDTIEITLNEKKYRARLDILALAETQYYLESRNKKITIPQIFTEISEENWFIISALLVFCIKSCNPMAKMVDIFDNMKYCERSEIISQVIDLINASMPKDDDADKKKEEE
ncbi:MAG: hypothetical protein J6J36_00525 [Clostridia bacterium]|nr:hypothetical protein [Clostridia bacterium]